MSFRVLYGGAVILCPLALHAEEVARLFAALAGDPAAQIIVAALQWAAWPWIVAIGIAAIAGGAIYIYITVGSLLWGKKLDNGSVSAKPTPIPPTTAQAAVQTYGSAGFAAPGTFVLAMVFLVAFVLYYFINWKYLSQVWGLS